MIKMNQIDEPKSKKFKKLINLNNDINHDNSKSKCKNGIWKNFIESTNEFKRERNQDSFLQDIICLDLTNEPNKKYSVNLCRDCLLKQTKDESECRFIGWRKLKINSKKEYQEIGFLNLEDSNSEDCSLWKLNPTCTNEDYQNDIKILLDINKPFLKLIETEINTREMFQNSLIWKRSIFNTRELCDQCSTSIFNGHMTCPKCGFSVCLDCYNLRLRNLKLNKGSKLNDQDSLNWYYCLNLNLDTQIKAKHEHKPNELIYVQFIPPHIVNNIYFECKKFLESTCHENLPINKVKCKENEDFYWSGDYFDKFLVLNCFNPNRTQSEQDDILLDLFDQEWYSKKPIVVKNLHENLNRNIWSPESFMNEFGHLTINLINCRNNRVVPNIPLKQFWLGFENLEERVLDVRGKPMIFKLKDWPTSDDFKTTLPDRFEDLMKNLPIKKFTQRNGQFNLASYLPEFFSLPDLGPKLYIAYSSADTPKDGTTKLHVDISDAINLMIYVGDSVASTVTNDGNEQTNGHKKSKHASKKSKLDKKISPQEENNSDLKLNQSLFEIIKESNCSKDQLDRFLNGEKPGALWHIFKPQDADKIRTFLLLCEINKGKAIANENDPIHDQIHYITNSMLVKLRDECDVKAYTIIQFLGDAIFIPAGAPHQVRNLNSCIKVAGDFVSPHGTEQCLLITEQFRTLSENHSNHQDKLQIKNILYHTVKKCLSNLKNSNLY